MELYKKDDLIGQITYKHTNGLIDINSNGTTLTVEASSNELKNYSSGGSIDLSPNSLNNGFAVKLEKGGYVDKDLAEVIRPVLPQFEFGGKFIPMKESEILLGKKINLKMPNGETRQAAFAIVELNSILASHNERSFASSLSYPVDSFGENINDRNYTNDKSAQARVLDWAQNLEPERLITTSRTPSGTPIIDPKGIVVSGNNRTMSLKLAAQDYPTNYKEYVNYLIEEIASFGLVFREKSPRGKAYRYVFGNLSDKTKSFDNPVLVRIDYDIKDLNTLELSKYNKDTKKADKPIDKAIKLGKILDSNEKCKSVIGNIIGQYEVFSQFYQNNNDQLKLSKALLDCDIITIQESPSYISETGFTNQGKELLENLLAGLVLTKEALIVADEKVKSFRAIVITSLPVLTANSLLGFDSLISKISEAVIIEGKIRSSKLDFKNWINQISMFDDPPGYEALMLNRLFNLGRNTFKSSILKYNESILSNRGANLFGEPPTQKQIFNNAITFMVPAEEINLINQLINSTNSKPTAPEPEKYNPFINGNYFKKHEDHILAKKVDSVDRWKKPIIEYKGNADDINDIIAVDNFLETFKKSNPTVSVVDSPVNEIAETDQETINNLKRAIKQSPKDVKKKRQRKKTIEYNPGSIETFSLKEVFNMPGLNDEISLEEVEVFLWYKIKKDKPITNSAWYELCNTSKGDLSKKDPKQWVKKGLLFYYKYELLPKYEYLSGDVYLKSQDLKSDKTKEIIVSTYGIETYNNQLEALNEVFKLKYDNRLLIAGPDSQSGIKLLPTSKFASKFKISSIKNVDVFVWKRNSKRISKFYGEPDYFTPIETTKKNQLFTFEELSLKEAFCYWLVSDKSVKTKIPYSDIISYYIQSKSKPKTKAKKDINGNYPPDQKLIYDAEEAEFERLKEKSKTEGVRLFLIFLNEQLILNDTIRLETEWNMSFNNIVPVNYNKVPVAFRMNKFIHGQPLDVRPEKRDAVAFTTSSGSGLLAYDVGVGKTPAAIFTICQFIDMGYCSRPIVVVPNQTYKQWISEFKLFAGHLKINELYNLDDSIIEDLQDDQGKTEMLPKQSVTIITFQGLQKLGFNSVTEEKLKPELTTILQQTNQDFSAKKASRSAIRTSKKVNEILGTALRKTGLEIEDLGIDYLCLDEAHAAKKVFTNVAGETQENELSEKTSSVSKYEINSGVPSSIAIKTFIICQYLQTNYNGNTQLLTATPFTNSPLEIYSMLAMISYNNLKKQNLANLNTFFDTFVEISYELTINAKMRPQRKQVIMGFNNLMVLQSLIRRFIDYKTGEEVNVIRPKKYVLPYTKKIINGVLTDLPKEDQVDCILPLTPIQEELMRSIKRYAGGEISSDVLCSGPTSFNEKTNDETPSVELNEKVLSKNEKAGVRVLKALNYARNLALSPYLFDCSGLGKPNYLEFINTSNKLLYTMNCIKSIKDHHISTKSKMGGVVIYMNRGLDYFGLVKEYLVKEIGFNADEIGIISSKEKSPVPRGLKDEQKKEYVKNLFLGQKFNNSTLEMEPVDDSERLKVLIGSGTIKEGMNLQKYSSTLFNLFLPWNPTDIQQVTGRIYRQKNCFENVRIVNPLMIDSMDIFMFQKLEEKTNRINTVWETDGRTNVLKTDDFDPKELKYKLIADPFVIAEMETIEKEEVLNEKIQDKRSEKNKILAIEEAWKFVTKNWEKITNQLSIYRDLTKFPQEIQGSMPTSLKPIDIITADNNNLLMFLETLKSNLLKYQNVVTTQKDKFGLPMKYRWNRTQEELDLLAAGELKFSTLAPLEKRSEYNEMVLKVRYLIKTTKELLIPTNINIEDILNDQAFETIESDIKNLQLLVKELKSEKSIKLIADRISNERNQEKYTPPSMYEASKSFSKLNYLLDKVKPLPEPVKTIEQCPPRSTNGVVKIDKKSIIQLEKCLKKLPQTKHIHSKEIILNNGTSQFQYSKERKKLHKEIVKDMTKNARCIENEKPIAILMGGSAGSGKSTFLRKNAKYMTSDKIWKIDADEVREYLPEYEGWNASATHLEVKDVVIDLLSEFADPCKRDLLYDGTMNNPDKYKPIIRQLKDLGYKVFIAYMEIPKEIAIERALNRYKENPGGKNQYGRYVPMEVIDEFFASGDKPFQQLKKMVNGYIKIDSLTGKVLDKGGEKIPTTRSYSEVFDDDQKQNNDISKEELQSAIEAAELSKSFLEGKKKEEMINFIESLHILLKYA